jgi:hypothetical protein
MSPYDDMYTLPVHATATPHTCLYEHPLYKTVTHAHTMCFNIWVMSLCGFVREEASARDVLLHHDADASIQLMRH